MPGLPIRGVSSRLRCVEPLANASHAERGAGRLPVSSPSSRARASPDTAGTADLHAGLGSTTRAA